MTEQTLTEALADYRQARKILDDPEITRFQGEAQEVVDRAERTMWEYPVPCMICGETETIQATLTVIAEWVGPPRMICGGCDSKAVLLIEMDKR